MTVLFADLAGYTKLSSSLDPEETNAILMAFFEVVDGTVAEFGGSIDKHIGDNVMALFGAPTAHDNDPERAVRASIEIHRRVAALGPSLGVTLRVHIGIAAGEVVASALGSTHHREYTVIGDAVNLAARLQDKASAGETIVSDSVKRPTAVMASYQPLGEVALKGLPLPATLWLLTGLRTEAGPTSQHPFVGRHAELQQLERVLSRCLDRAKGTTVLLRGEAGIGKSRLLTALRERALAAGFQAHGAFVLDFGDARGHGVASVLARSISAASGMDLGDADLTFARELLGLPATEDARRLLDSMTDAVRERSLREALSAIVRVGAKRAPLLLFVEDVHWADATTIADLQALAALTAGLGVVLVLTSRPEGAALEWTTAPDSPQLTVALVPLREEDSLALATSVAADDETLRRCIARAGGNPLFLEQLLEAAREGGASDLPPTIQSVVVARVDRLATRDRQLLQAASVLGQRFDPKLARVLSVAPAPSHAAPVAKTLGQEGTPAPVASPGAQGQAPDEAEDAEAFDSLVAQGLVRDEGDAMRFHHALIRDGVYATLTRSRRRDLHRLAASALASRDPVLRAEHLDRAGDPEAGVAYIDAARELAERHQLAPAIALSDRAATLLEGTSQSFAARITRAELYVKTGVGPQMVGAFEAARAVAQNERDELRALLGMAMGQRLSGAPREVLATVEQAEPIAQRLADDVGLAAINGHRGGAAFIRGDAIRCREEYEKSLVHARRAGDPEAIARALSGLGDAFYMVGPLARAEALFLECLEVCESAKLDRYALPNRLMLTSILAASGRFREAVEVAAEVAALARRLGDQRIATFAELQPAYCFTLLGKYEQADPLYERLTERALAAGARLFAAEVMALECLALLQRGRRDEGLAVIRRAWAVCESDGIEFFGASASGILAQTTEDPDERTAALRRGEEIVAKGCMLVSRVWFYVGAIEARLEDGQLDEVERYVRELEGHLAHETARGLRVTLMRGAALLAARRAPDAPETVALLRTALAELQALELAPSIPAVEAALAAVGAEAG